MKALIYLIAIMALLALFPFQLTKTNVQMVTVATCMSRQPFLDRQRVVEEDDFGVKFFSDQ